MGLLVLGEVGGGLCLATPTEHEVKAAFIVNFTRFVDWPQGTFAKADAPFVIGIVGRDTFGGAIERATQGKSAGGHSLTVRRVHSDAEFKACQILFVSPSEGERVPKIVAAVKGSPVLTVGEAPGFAKRGGVINLLAEGDRVRIEVNADAAARAHLVVSSRLLGIAKVVKDDGR